MDTLKVVHHSVASLDGRLTLAPGILLLYGDPRWQEAAGAAGSSGEVYAKIKALHNPQALLEGSGSLVLEGQQSEPLPPCGGDARSLYQDFLPENVVNQPNRRWLTVVDGRGRVRWLYKEFPGEQWEGWYLLVLVCSHTPAEYLAYLQRENIPYLVAGEERVDLKDGLRKLSEKLGVQRLVSTAGGRLNGALLRAGLIDEVNIEFFPALIGGAGTPALFDAPPLLPEEHPTRLKLISAQVQADGHIWLRYQVCSNNIKAR